MQKKKIGVIVDGLIVSKQVYEMIEASGQYQNFEITHLVVQNTKHSNKSKFIKGIDYIKTWGINKFLRNLVFKTITAIENIALKSINFSVDNSQKYDLSNFNLSIINAYPLVSKNGLVFRYRKEDLKSIRECNLQLLIRCCSGILRGEILNICSGGIISFHHGDNEKYRGGPPAFWETRYKDPKLGFIIQRLNDQLDGGDVLFRGFVQNSWLFTLNQKKIYEISNPFILRIIENLTSSSPTLVPYPKVPYYSKIYTLPSVKESFIYFFNSISILAIKVLRKLMRKRLSWEVGYMFSEDWRDISLSKLNTIPNPHNRYLADPFIIRKNNQYYCFVEDYDFDTNLGKISVYLIDKTGSKEIGCAISEGFHLSYPYIFEFENEIYMCPETSDIDEIRLYRCVEFPLKWEFHCTLMKDVSAADTIIFSHENRYWMFTNISTSSFSDHSSELHIFYTSDPLRGEWIPHKNNPVIFDSQKARNGGFFESDGEYYRIFQTQGYDIYGESCGCSKILKLTHDEYVENIEFFVEPKFFPGLKGTHTFNVCDNLIVCDYLRYSK